MKSHRTPLTDGPVRGHLIAMTLPMLWGWLALMSFQFADTWFVAQLGTAPLAAMSFTFPVVMVMGGISVGLSVGTASVIARAIGAGEEYRVRRLSTDALALALVVSILLAAVGVATIDPLFRLLGATDELLPLIRSYMTIWYLGLPLLVVSMSALAAIRAVGNARLPAQLMMSAAVLNVVIDPILIFGLLGAPRLEIEGAAWASVIARGLTGAFAANLLLRRFALVDLRRPALGEIVSSWRSVLHISLPAASSHAIIRIANGVIVAMLASHGTEAVAGYGVAMRIEALVMVVYFAMSSMIAPVVGQNLGAGQHERILEAMRLSARFAVAHGLLLAALLWPAAPYLAGLFSDDPRIIETATLYLRIVPVSYGAAAIVMLVNSAFNGLGRPLPATVVSLGRMVVLYLPLAVLGGWLAGIPGIFAAYTAANLAVAAVALPWFTRACRQVAASPRR